MLMGKNKMTASGSSKLAPVSIEFDDEDLAIIDRGASLLGLSRAELVPRATLQEAQAAILNETVISLSPEAFDDFVRAISTQPSPPSAKVVERLGRTAL
jgi:uncharacterized protein (DUF1778 family)